MKKLIFSFLGIAVVATAIYAEALKTKNTAAGQVNGTTTTQKQSWWAATPTNQITVTLATNDIGATTSLTTSNISAQLKSLEAALAAYGLIKTN